MAGMRKPNLNDKLSHLYILSICKCVCAYTCILLYYAYSILYIEHAYKHYIYIQVVSKGSLQNFRRDRAHHKDSELHRNLCPQTSS